MRGSNEDRAPRAAHRAPFLPAAAWSHYDTLELPPDATPAEIREAFTRLSKAHHEVRGERREARGKDRCAPSPLVSRLSPPMSALITAYEMLADPRRRAEYDWRLGIDDLQPLDWGGAAPEPHPLETLRAANRERLQQPPYKLHGWIAAWRQRRFRRRLGRG